MRISFLVHNCHGIGGTVRTVVNLAAELSRHHRVEIVSILRHRDTPMLPIPPAVAVVSLADIRPGSADLADPRFRQPSTLIPEAEAFHRHYNRLTDERIGSYLRRTGADVIVGTREGLSLCVARLAGRDTVRIAQEHLTQTMIPEPIRAERRRHYPRLSAVVTVSEADARTVRTQLHVASLPVLAVPNSVPDPGLPPADGTSRIVVAAGRLVAVKRYEVLISAFAEVVAQRPDWTLRIYGAGGQRSRLAALIAGLGLHDHVFLMGAYTPLEAEWVKGSIAAVTSARESFGMTIVEAMRCGLPVVSTDCPSGPAEIIQDGVDGLLVPPGDVGAISAALLRLINDDRLRRSLGRAARQNSARFDPAVVAARYEHLFSRLRPGLTRSRASGLAAPARALRTGLIMTLPSRLRRADPRYAADCRMDGNRITVSVPHGRPCRPMTHLLARSRGRAPVVRLPLTGHRTSWQASFAADEALLAEGRWDLYLEDRWGHRHRLRAGRLDVRGLLSGCAETGPLVRQVPYPTRDRFLAVAAWQRDQHAEVETLRYDDDRITVGGRLIAQDFGSSTPHLTLVRRGSPGTLTVAGETSGGGDFRADVPLGRLAGLRESRHEKWDAQISRGADGEPVLLGRLLDDIVERKTTYVYPPAQAAARIRPYYTVHSGLAFTVTAR